MTNFRDLVGKKVRIWDGPKASVRATGEVVGIIEPPTIIVRDDLGVDHYESSSLPREVLDWEPALSFKVGKYQLVFAPAHPAFRRIDVVAYQGGWEELKVFTGFPAGTPVPPMLPPGWNTFAQIIIRPRHEYRSVPSEATR